MATEAQIRKIHAVQHEAGMSRLELMEKIEEVVGHNVSDLDDLTTREASSLIDAIEDELGGTPA